MIVCVPSTLPNHGATIPQVWNFALEIKRSATNRARNKKTNALTLLACHFGAGLKSVMLLGFQGVAVMACVEPKSQKPTAGPSESAMRRETYSNSVSLPNISGVFAFNRRATIAPRLVDYANLPAAPNRVAGFLGASS